MHFDDSLFESDFKAKEEKRLKASDINYQAKICELNWFTDANTVSVGNDFMLLKYRADLLYYQKQYESALTFYEATLEAVPLTNNVVVREMNQSLVKCRLHLKQSQLALETAWLLVQPPHENDSSAWKLIADCQGAMVDTVAQVVSLQKCASLQRYQFDYWMNLSRAHSELNKQYSSMEGGLPDDWTQFGLILETSISLFRPYFSWLSLAEQLKRIALEVRQITFEQENSISSNCHSSCIFNTDSHSIYTDSTAKVAAAERHCLMACLPHSLFPMLSSGQLSTTDCVSGLEKLSSSRHYKLARDLVSSFLTMAECSCLLWARQLLLYFVRYSHSFVAASHKTELTRVDQQLLSCDKTVVDFLEQYFNKNRVFEESQNKDENSDS